MQEPRPPPGPGRPRPRWRHRFQPAERDSGPEPPNQRRPSSSVENSLVPVLTDAAAALNPKPGGATFQSPTGNGARRGDILVARWDRRRGRRRAEDDAAPTGAQSTPPPSRRQDAAPRLSQSATQKVAARLEGRHSWRPLSSSGVKLGGSTSRPFSLEGRPVRSLAVRGGRAEGGRDDGSARVFLNARS